MYKQINKQLLQYHQEIYRLRKIESMLSSLKEELVTLEKESQSAKAKLEKEYKDYEKLTPKSLSVIFYTILGNLKEKTEKEHREALEAEIKYTQSIRNLEDINKRILTLEAEKPRYKNSQEEYDKLYDEKLNLLMSENTQTAEKIMELNKRLELSQSNIREIEEAITAGQEVQRSLTEVLEKLDSAEVWGMWDMTGGGGLMSAIMKHKRINAAAEILQHTQTLLRHFRTELVDIRISEEIQINIGDFAWTVDFFYDGLLIDWLVQNQIEEAQDSVHTVQHQIQDAICRLNQLKEIEEKKQDDLNMETNKMVVGASLRLAIQKTVIQQEEVERFSAYCKTSLDK